MAACIILRTRHDAFWMNSNWLQYGDNKFTTSRYQLYEQVLFYP